ncbi:hypothetical protein PPUN15366_19070 [Pseudomonas putida]|uniref:hypothetical protein n=1 Tax=Pseudomonas putida TaxID=303 RepID=UPI00235C9126|nr:hypothetical protein [Pseudomonas putida]GLO40263.1 hypothetical protein PPUN15366_19070 [Pseudomonas putida]HDS0978129.1 hypothetical protein [Pseudomonas putida]
MYLVITYGFPVILILFELGIRAVIKIDTSAFIGPALASAALCFLAALTKPKEMAGIHSVEVPGYISVKKVDSNFIGFVWLMILAALGAWGASCVISNRELSEQRFMLLDYDFSIPLVIGVISYMLSLLMTAIKEKL